MLLTSFRRARRGLVVLSTVALLTGVAGFAALPASAAPAAAIVPAIVSPMDGTTIHDVPDVNGTGDPGTTVVITDGGGTTVCSAPVDGLGNFACTGAGRLPAGLNELTVSTSAPEATVGNTVQIQALYYPSLSFPESGSMISSRAAFNGVALPGAQIQMLDAAQNPVCTTTADEFGNFQCIPQSPFPLGPLTLTPSMTTADHAVTAGETAKWTVIADPVITSPKSGDVVGDLPVFSGTGYPGAAVDIVGGHSGLSLCSAKVAADGTFSCPMTRRLTVGTVDVFPALGWASTSSVAGPMITVAVEVTPKIIRPADRGIIAASPVIEGTAGVFTLIAILDEQGTTLCTTKTDINGNFGCLAGVALSPGYHSLTPVQTSFAGIAVNGASVRVTVPGSVPGTASPSTTPATQSPTPTTAPPATTSAATTDPTIVVAAQGQVTGGLANTGANGIAVAGFASGGLLVVGVGALLLLRRRTRTH